MPQSDILILPVAVTSLIVLRNKSLQPQHQRMQRIFFYCARQAYKGIGDNEEMYKILELPDKNASQEVVNEALRIAMSTRKEDTAKFEKVAAGKYIYDFDLTPLLSIDSFFYSLLQLQLAEGVLGDPRKRRLYDDVGYAGYLFLMSGSAQFDVVTFAVILLCLFPRRSYSTSDSYLIMNIAYYRSRRKAVTDV